MSSIPVVTASLPPCHGCVSPRRFVSIYLLRSQPFFPFADTEFTFVPPPRRQTHRQPAQLLTSVYFLARLTPSCTAGEMTKLPLRKTSLNQVIPFFNFLLQHKEGQLRLCFVVSRALLAAGAGSRQMTTSSGHSAA